MDSKFKNVPLEEDTRLLSQKIIYLSKFEVLHQIWRWDGIKGESIIFADEDVKDLSENDIKGLLRNSKFLHDKDSSLTFSQKGNGFTFLNFNFDPG